MNIKKYLIFFLLCIIFLIISMIFKTKNTILICDSVLDAIASEPPSSSNSYTFVCKWGGIKGNGDGEFGSGPFYWYRITDETIEKLKSEIDAKKLEKLTSLKNIEYNDDEIIEYLLQLGFDDYETFTIANAAGLDKPGGRYVYGPLDIAVDLEGNVYVSDFYNDRIQKFDSWGNFICKWGSKGHLSDDDDPDGQFNHPKDIAVDLEGNVYVVDSRNYRIQKFDSQGNFICKWGSKGKEDTQFSSLGGITVDLEGNILIRDTLSYSGRSQSYIKKFDSQGHFLDKWLLSGRLITKEDGVNLNEPSGFGKSIIVDSYGHIYSLCWLSTILFKTNDLLNPISIDRGVVKYDSLGEYITNWGKYGEQDGQFIKPVDLTIDSENNIFVLDKERSNIQKFDSKGNFICKWGEKGSKEGEFLYPQGIAVDSQGNVYVMDTGNRRIQKFVPNQKLKKTN